MANIEHSDIVDPYIHEPKGVASASEGTVYLADGTGSGDWTEVQSLLKLGTQGTPAAKTVTTTLTAAELLTGLIIGNQAAAGAATYTLPLGTDIEAAFIALYPALKDDDCFEFVLINTSTVAAEDITVAGNTGTTLVGKAAVISNDATTTPSQGTFLVRRVAPSTYTVYRTA